MDEICLARAARGDAGEIFAMQTAAFRALLDKYQDKDTSPGAERPDDTLRRFDEAFTHYYFICLGDVRVGVLRVCDFGRIALLKQMFIQPRYQGRGYAQQAIRLAEALYPKAEEWRLDTILQEEKLCYLYEKMGYRRTGETQNIREGMDLVFYAKRV